MVVVTMQDMGKVLKTPGLLPHEKYKAFLGLSAMLERSKGVIKSAGLTARKWKGLEAEFGQNL